ncbi:beta-L-arabinofuranosidase domain-containing protein [Mariniradius sediminis]|uniref:Glycoside hydrolase family 127 protein n=1 Tax=Mariniradius sediminis TaxID=2909237 RepID=A0ABS9BSZ3_9BACT|nr:beta-L-arabinofuranosidase domain-containing protein [Mariniradius sediminis]MCF1751179.1 glycoside hydrolase family 127 protein [Mariniradius sediminis]
MYKSVWLFFLWTVLLSCSKPEQKKPDALNAHYLSNRSPLAATPYLELPLGSIKANGWLEDQLRRMADGLTGHLDEIYPEVVGTRNGWLGGDGDGWERGPYWIDGLLPLAYILDDERLKQKAQPWIEWTLANQAESGYLGPIPFETEPEPERGIQKGPREDWWPKMVMLKVLQQYYQATGDERVITALTKYFQYQLKMLPEKPLDHLSLWANRRAGDNLMVVYWLYNITGDAFLLELGDLIQEQTFPWQKIYTNAENPFQFDDTWFYNKLKRYPFDSTEMAVLTISKIPGLHTVNVAQGLKQPLVYYQKSKDSQALPAVKKALGDLKQYHGQPTGMYGGDEPLHGNNPVQGIELCSIAEEMFSLETNLKITGDMEFADLLERITYNALPTQASDDYRTRQYFQAANQVELTDQLETSFEKTNHEGTDFVFGVLSGYPCCTTNMHQSWPKFVQNLFYATPDRGVAALLYAPSTVQMTVADGVTIKIVETTGFPFRDRVDFALELSKGVEFPFHLRIPAWAKDPKITINGQAVDFVATNQVAVLNRTWKNGDKVTLTLPMELKTSTWYKGMVAIERGPLVFSLKVESENRQKDRKDRFRAFWEVFPKSDWNYALEESFLGNISGNVALIEREWNGEYPWNLENAPIELRLKGVHLPEWRTVKSAPELSENIPQVISPAELERRKREITLVPYGCTTLRITEFPVVRVE